MPRYRPVTIRMAPTTWALLKTAADEEGISVADFVRGSVQYVLGVRAGIKLAMHEDSTAGLILQVLGVELEDYSDEPLPGPPEPPIPPPK